MEGNFEHIPEAVAFGDVISSHAEIIIKKREVNREYVCFSAAQLKNNSNTEPRY